MSHFILQKNAHTDELVQLIETCKSSNLKTGKRLRDAHTRLGNMLATNLRECDKKNLTVVILMRAGLCFGMGIVDQLEKMGIVPPTIFITEDQIPEQDMSYIQNRNVLVVDAVINSGNSALGLTKQLSTAASISFATAVIPEDSLDLLKDYFLYCARTSKNKYVGAKVKKITQGKGPDTGDRLFNTL